jgi:haloalkane dehalogenase
MREFSKSLLSYSWAMSVFGLQQLFNLFTPPGPSRTTSPATDAFNRVACSVEDQLGGSMGEFFRAGDQLQRGAVDAFARVLNPADWGQMRGRAGAPDPRRLLGGARSDPREELVIRYTRGQGRFSPDKKFIALNMKMYTLDGAEDGYHQGVWERLFEQPRDLLARPGQPQGPFDQPQGPVEAVRPVANTKAIWVFGDGSSVTTLGPAASHLIPLADGSFQFLVSTAQIITNGTGRYAGAFGLTQSLGATHVPQGTDLFGGGSTTFPATTLDTFRILPARFRGQAPPQPRPAPAGGRAASFPFRSHYASVEGERMHYVDEGSGAPILLLHGNPTYSYVWRNVIPHLTPLGRCVAPDLIGMGKSGKPALDYRFFDHVRYLEGFIEALGLKGITLVGQDWGTALAFYYAARHPENVRGIAFMEAILKPYESWEQFPAALRDRFKEFRAPDLGFELVVLRNAFIEEVLPRSVMRQLTPEEMNAYREPFRDPASRKPIWRFANEIPIAGEPRDVAQAIAEYSRKLRESRLPKLLVYASPGAITSEAEVRWCKQHLKNLSCADVGPGIHFLQEDSPDKVGAEIARWYRGICS